MARMKTLDPMRDVVFIRVDRHTKVRLEQVAKLRAEKPGKTARIAIQKFVNNKKYD